MTQRRGLVRELWSFRSFWRPQLPTLGLGLALRGGELLVDMAKPWPLAIVVDEVLGGRQSHTRLAALVHRLLPGTTGELTVIALALLVLTVASGAFDYLGDRVLNGAGEAITAAVRSRVFAHLQRLPMSYHDGRAAGELTSRVSTDTDRIEASLVALFSTLIPGTLSIAGYAAVMLLVDARLGLIAVACAPVVLRTSIRYTRLTKEAAQRRRDSEGNLAGMVSQSLDGIRTVHALGSHGVLDRQFKRHNTSTLGAAVRAVELKARFTPALEIVTGVGTAVLLWVGGLGAVKGWWTAGLVTVVLSYMRDMLKPMRALSSLSITLAQGAASAERIREILDVPLPLGRSPQPLPERAAGRLDLREVSFDYGAGRGRVLRRVSLSVEPGERVALLGPNGSGKSTTIALVAGLYAPSSGSVTLDGMPLGDLPPQWLRRQIALVLQDTFLFSGSIGDNIRYARPEATRAEVERAARAALVTEFTDVLPDGLATRLADHGRGLSGGQRQRVGIARALLRDAPVVLLDEPTTGLDGEAEELVVNALARLMADRTVIMTTHRAALLRLATRKVQLGEGLLATAHGRTALPQVGTHRPAPAMADRVGR